VTYDLERLMPGATKVGTSAFASAIIENMKGVQGALARKQILTQRRRERGRFAQTTFVRDKERHEQKKVTVVGGGFVGSTTAQRIVDMELGRRLSDRHFGRPRRLAKR